MRKSHRDKIIVGITMISLFAVSVFCLSIKTQKVEAGDFNNLTGGTFGTDNFANNNYSDYKFNVSNVMDSGLLSSVIGCTGITDKLTKAIARTFGDATNTIKNKVKETTGNDIPVSNSYLSFMSSKLQSADQTLSDDKKREECYKGLAVSLARKQLADMTQKTVNWINSGYNGEAFFMKDPNSFYRNMSNSTLKDLLAPFSGDPTKYPFGKSFARGQIINARNVTQEILAQRFTTNSQTFNNGSFSSGGWDEWLNITQNPGNNPLGFNMGASDYITQTIDSQILATDKELMQGNGFLSQKKCVEYEKILAPDYQEGQYQGFEGYDPNGNYSLYANKTPKCKTYEIVTPGSVIASRANSIADTAAKQLEMANDINSSLKSIFSALVDSLMNWGLSSLDGTPYANPDNQSIFASEKMNTVSDIYGNDISGQYLDSAGQIIKVKTGSGWVDAGGKTFDVTTDIGPNCVGSNITNGSAPNPGIISIQQDYIDAIKGNPKNIDPNSLSLTKVWKKIGIVTNENQRTVINAKKSPGGSFTNAGGIDEGSLGNLQYIMPALGELDYCIPGPNPGWEQSTQMALNATISYYQDFYIGNDGRPVPPDPLNYKNEFVDLTQPWIQLNIPNISADLSTAFSSNDLEDFENRNSWLYSLDGIGLTSTVDSIICMFKDCKSNAERQAEAQAKMEAKWEAKQEEFDSAIKDMISKLKIKFEHYRDFINQTYGYDSSMLKEDYYGYDENGIMKSNPQNLKMGISGLELTKNIGIYSLNVDDATTEYNNLINQTKSNIYQLQQIQKKVDDIVKAATQRMQGTSYYQELILNFPKGCVYYKLNKAGNACESYSPGIPVNINGANNDNANIGNNPNANVTGSAVCQIFDFKNTGATGGNPTNLYWDTNGCTKIGISGGASFIGLKPTGSVPVNPLSDGKGGASITYTLSASGANNSKASQKITINLVDAISGNGGGGGSSNN